MRGSMGRVMGCLCLHEQIATMLRPASNRCEAVHGQDRNDEKHRAL